MDKEEWFGPKWVAPEGKRWVCGACGKTAKHLAGYTDEAHCESLPFSSGWDESCMLNANLEDDV